MKVDLELSAVHRDLENLIRHDVNADKYKKTKYDDKFFKFFDYSTTLVHCKI